MKTLRRDTLKKMIAKKSHSGSYRIKGRLQLDDVDFADEAVEVTQDKINVRISNDVSETAEISVKEFEALVTKNKIVPD